jgi:hypothetical protein
MNLQEWGSEIRKVIAKKPQSRRATTSWVTTERGLADVTGSMRIPNQRLINSCADAASRLPKAALTHRRPAETRYRDLRCRVRSGRPRAAAFLAGHRAHDTWHGVIGTWTQCPGLLHLNSNRTDSPARPTTTCCSRLNESVTMSAKHFWGADWGNSRRPGRRQLVGSSGILTGFSR